MELFETKNGHLYTVTKFGSIEHKFSQFVSTAASEVTFKDAYTAFVDQFYTNGTAVLGQNGKAYIMIKKDVYVAPVQVVTNTENFSVKFSAWTKVDGLKTEFKSIIKAVNVSFKPEPKQEKPTTPAVEKTEGK
jgi:hypothetical protein